MSIMNHWNKCCSVSMRQKIQEPERIEDKCNILPKTLMALLPHKTGHPSEIKRL